MNRSDVVRGVANITSLNQVQAREALDAIVGIIQLAAHENDDVTIAGLGKFTVRNRPATKRRNPGTGEQVDVPARKTITFKASQVFRDRI